jgi:hypothetical protein
MGYNMAAHGLGLEVTVWNKASKKEMDEKDKQFISLPTVPIASRLNLGPCLGSLKSSG